MNREALEEELDDVMAWLRPSMKQVAYLEARAADLEEQLSQLSYRAPDTDRLIRAPRVRATPPEVPR